MRRGGPAASGGLEIGDIIVALDGEAITDARELQLKIASLAPGRTVKLRVLHKGSERDVTMTLGELPNEEEPQNPDDSTSALDGVDVDELSPKIAHALGLPDHTFGVLVSDVDPDSPAAEAGLQRGDVIQQVNRKRVANVAEFERTVRASGRDPLLFLVNRQGDTMFLLVEPD